MGNAQQKGAPTRLAVATEASDEAHPRQRAILALGAVVRVAAAQIATQNEILQPLSWNYTVRVLGTAAVVEVGITCSVCSTLAEGQICV